MNPGSREYLRAAVDYDGLGSEDRFNLIVQRLAVPGTEQVQAQEILRNVSIEPGSARFVADMLQSSTLARVSGEVPAVRPDATSTGVGGLAVGYVGANADGDDGAPLSDYDIIGSLPRRTGLFALGPDAEFDLLYIPPLTRDHDIGMSTLLVRGRFCRDRRALQIVDPPQTWTSSQEALDGLAAWPLRSDNVAMFFPRLLAFDRLRNRLEPFAPGGRGGRHARAQRLHRRSVAADRRSGRGAAARAASDRRAGCRSLRAPGAVRHQRARAAASGTGPARAQLHALERGFGIRRGPVSRGAAPGPATGEQRGARDALGC